MQNLENYLFTTFLLKKTDKGSQIKCLGCRELIIPQYDKPVYMIGAIDIAGKYAPVIDISYLLYNKPSNFSHSSGILTVSYQAENDSYFTAILIEDCEEILKLAAGLLTTGAGLGTSINMHFVLELWTSRHSLKMLADTHNEIQNRFDRISNSNRKLKTVLA